MTKQQFLDFNKSLREAYDEKYLIEGEYSPETSVGLSDSAESLSPYGPNSGALDYTPFIFQTSGGESDIGSRAYLKKLSGNSIIWNQLVKIAAVSETTTNGLTYSKTTSKFTISGTAEADTTVTVINSTVLESYDNSHKLLIKWNLKGDSANDSLVYANLFGRKTDLIDKIEASSVGSNTYCQITIKSGAEVDFSIEPQIFDLTKMFGAGYEPTTVASFIELFPSPYYEYDAGSFISAKSSSYKVVGYNAFSGALKKGYYINDENSGEVEYDGDIAYAVSENFIQVVPGQEYTFEVAFDDGNTVDELFVAYYDADKNFIDYEYSGDVTIPSNCRYVLLQLSANDEIDVSKTHFCLHLTWDESKTGYEEHWEKSYTLPNLALSSVGNIKDELLPSGTLIRRVVKVKLSDLTWTYAAGSGTYGNVFKGALVSNVNAADYGYSKVPTNLAVNKRYKVTSLAGTEYNGGTDLTITWRNNKILQIHDSAFDGDLASFLLAIADIYVQYELETPVVTQSDSYKFLELTEIDDWGTQEFVGSEVPQSAEFFYFVDYKAFIDSLGGREDIEYDASEVVSHSELTEALGEIPQPDMSEYAEKSIVSFPIISAPSSTTLTDDEVATIIKGCVINGSFLGYTDIVLFPAILYGSAYYGKFYAGGRPSYEGVYQISNSTNYISILSDKNIRLDGIEKINGKTVPDYPSNPTVSQQLIYDTNNTLKYTNISGFPIIPAPSSTTLTNDEVSIISSGAVVLSSFLGYEKCVFFPIGIESFGEKAGMVVGVNGFTPEIRAYKISSQNVISLYGDDAGRTRLSSIARFNGKNVPAYPSSTGTFVLKCVNGTLTWVAE